MLRAGDLRQTGIVLGHRVTTTVLFFYLNKAFLLIHITWMNLKCVMLGEGSQPQKVTYIGRFHLYHVPEKAKLKEQETDQWLPGVGGGGRCGIGGAA